MAQILAFTVLGAPRTKKTSNQVWKNRRTGKRIVAPSEAFLEWQEQAVFVVGGANLLRIPQPWGDAPCNLSAVFYRDANRGDLAGYVQGLQDLFTKRGVWLDDKVVRGNDGQRLRVDAKNPRVEVVITEMTPEEAYG